MKKSLALLLVAVLLLGGFQFLSEGGVSSDESEEVDFLNLCVIVPSEFGDKSFNDSARVGAENLVEDFDVKLSTVECKNEGYKQQLMTAAKDNDMVVAVGWEFSEIKQVATEYPDTKFIWVDNVVDGVESCPNILCITYKQNEGSFLVGYVAARLSQTNAVGVVGGEEESSVIKDFVKGFEQGARYANGGIKVYESYANGYEDPASGELCAKELHAQGADVIFQVAGNTGNGVFKAAKAEGFYAIGVDMDQKLSAPEYDSVIACSMMKNVGASIYDTVSEYIENDSWDGGRNRVLGMEDGYISVAYGDENSAQLVDDDTKRAVAEIANDIVSGKITVKSEM